MTTLREMLTVMEAAAAGEPIQCRLWSSDSKWEDVETPDWDWPGLEYRVKPVKPQLVLDGTIFSTALDLPTGSSGQYASKEVVREVFQAITRTQHCCGCTKKKMIEGFRKMFDEEL